MARGAVRLDKLQAVYAGNIESVQASVELDNGSVVAIGGLVGNGGEVVTASAPTDVTTQEVLLVASPEVIYDERETLLDFYNPANKPARAYHLTVGDIVTVTDNMINGTSVVGQYLVPENGSYKLAPAADLSGNTRFAALVIAKEKVYGEDATVFRVIKC